MSKQSEIEKFTKALVAIGCLFTVANERVEVTKGYVYLGGLTSLPEGTTFSNGGGVYLGGLTSLPEGTTFSNGGYVDLGGLTSLPEGTTFSNGGGVYLNRLTSLPEGTTFSNGGGVYLGGLTSLPEGTTFSNGGYVDLGGLTSLPEGTTFSNGGGVYLNRLTSLPEGTTFSNGGGVYLGGLPAGQYPYHGQTIRLECVDGYTMVICSERQVGEYAVQSCRYFGGGDLDNLKACYVARSGGYTAHGESAEGAIRDVRFKAMQADFDVDELVETIKARGTIEFNDFRLLTGACEEGLCHGLEEAGISPDTEEIPLAAALKAAHGSYGAAFQRLFADA